MSRDKRQTFTDYLEHIQAIYMEHGLINVIEEGEYLTKFADHVGHLRPEYNKDGRVDFQQEDLVSSVHETRFAIANVLLMAEIGLTDILIDQTERGAFPEFFPNVLDHRFFYFADDVFMRLYNFWNRVANFLNIFFRTESNEERVYFPGLIDNLVTLVASDPSFQSLQEFRRGEYKDLINKKRRVVVHRQCSSVAYFVSFLKKAAVPENVREPARLRQEMSALQKERDELPEFFLASYRRMIQGLDEMLALIKRNVK